MAQRWSPQRYAPMAEYLFSASRATVEALAVGPGDLLVDCATGTGNAAVVAVERGLRVLGLDSSSEQVAEAHRRCRHPGAWFVVADAQYLPLRTARADAAVSVFGLIFAADPELALAELARCVRPGGQVAFTTLCAGGWPSGARDVLASVLEIAPPAFPEMWSTPDAAQAAAATAGLKTVATRRHELRLPLDPGRSFAEQVTVRMGGLAVLREQLERHQLWPQARDRLDNYLAGCARTGPSGCELLDQYLLVIGRRR